MIRRLLTWAQGASTTQDTAVEIVELLATLAAIPQSELPDGAARDALIEAIRCGEVDGLYRPVARPHHNVTLAHLPADVDPRITVAQWAQWWRDGKNPRDELLAEHTAAVARGRELLAEREAQARAFLTQRQEEERQAAQGEPSEQGGRG